MEADKTLTRLRPCCEAPTPPPGRLAVAAALISAALMCRDFPVPNNCSARGEGPLGRAARGKTRKTA